MTASHSTLELDLPKESQRIQKGLSFPFDKNLLLSIGKGRHPVQTGSVSVSLLRTSAAACTTLHIHTALEIIHLVIAGLLELVHHILKRHFCLLPSTPSKAVIPTVTLVPEGPPGR